MENWRKFATLGLFIVFFGHVYAQQAHKEIRYVARLKDSIAYKVWLPDNWNAQQKYPLMVMYNYGAANDQVLAATVNYYANHLQKMPNTIVVNIMVNMDQIGYNYETGALTEAGKNLVLGLREEIFPAIRKKYGASAYTSYIGQSYAASYANYLFLNDPTLFNAYILIAPEKIGEGQPGFEISEGNQRFYSKNKRIYFVASGEDDMARRIAYAEEIAQKAKSLDTISFKFKYRHFANADHNTLFAYALPNALEFLYKPYQEIWDGDDKLTVYQQLQQAEARLKNYYGISLEPTFKNYNGLLMAATQQKDTSSLLAVIKHFENERCKGIDYRNFGYMLNINGLAQLAYTYYQKALDKINSAEIHTKSGHQALVTCYRDMALNFNKDKPAQGWELLEKALKDPYIRDVSFKYDLGKFAVENNTNVEQGLNYLLSFANDRKNMVDIINVPYRRINLLLAKAYAILKDKNKSIYYVQLVLKEEPKNTDALALLEKWLKD